MIVFCRHITNRHWLYHNEDKFNGIDPFACLAINGTTNMRSNRLNQESQTRTEREDYCEHRRK